MIDTVVRKLIEYGYERAFQQLLLANAVRLGDEQLPSVWQEHRAALARLDIKEIPELYLAQMPIINAMAVGSQRPMVVLNSGTVNALDDMEMRTVLGHEAAHILSDHVLYSDGAGDPAQHPRATAADGRPAAAGGQARAARVVPRRGAVLRPRGDARQPQPDDDLPDD